MRVAIRLFAVARQVAGQDTIEVELPEGASVGELRQRILEQVPALTGIIDRSMIAVNSDYVGDAVQIHAGDDVACIPPVSGG